MNVPYQSAFDIDLNPDPLWCSWFSGFVAGEGYFGSYISKRTKAIFVWLQIHLRDDDAQILYEIKETLKCGRIHSRRNRERYGVSYHDQLNWECKDIGQCRFILMPLFDQYPLRAKKKRDYEIWRKLTIAISEGQHVNGNREYVLDLCQKLKDVKRYTY